MPSQWEAEAGRAAADDAARNAYQSGMLELGNQQLAFQKAQQAWKETMDKAGLTGQYEGAWTMPTQMGWGGMFGTWGTPVQGQRTLEGQRLDQQTAQNYLTLLSNLRGPADWAKYQQVLGATPGGMRDLVGAAMGQYIPGGGATTGVQPQAANLQSMYGQIAGVGQQFNQGAAQQTQQMLQGQTNPQAYAQQAMAQPQQQNNQAVNAQGAGTNTMGAPQQNQYQLQNYQPQQWNLPAPNQIAPQSWNNLAPSQREMLMGMYEAQGWHKPDVEALRTQALPKYAANAPTAGTWRMT